MTKASQSDKVDNSFASDNKSSLAKSTTLNTKSTVFKPTSLKNTRKVFVPSAKTAAKPQSNLSQTVNPNNVNKNNLNQMNPVSKNFVPKQNKPMNPGPGPGVGTGAGAPTTADFNQNNNPNSNNMFNHNFAPAYDRSVFQIFLTVKPFFGNFNTGLNCFILHMGLKNLQFFIIVNFTWL